MIVIRSQLTNKQLIKPPKYLSFKKLKERKNMTDCRYNTAKVCKVTKAAINL